MFDPIGHGDIFTSDRPAVEMSREALHLARRKVAPKTHTVVMTGTGLSWAYNDGGRADAGFARETDRDCVVRAITIATGRPYREIHDMVDAAGAEMGITSAEAGVDLTLVARLLARDVAWQPIDVHNARLTQEDLDGLLAEHRVLIAEVEFSELRSRNDKQVSVRTAHLTAVAGGVVQDIDGMLDRTTGRARICDLVQLYAPLAAPSPVSYSSQ